MLKLVEVQSFYYHSRLNMIEDRLRGFISDTVDASKYYLVFGKEGLPVGGFAIGNAGWLLGLFSLERGLGDALIPLALKTAKELLPPDTSIHVFCTGEFLRKLYQSKGFEVYDFVAWDDREASSRWCSKEFGTPPLYYMENKSL